MVTKIHSRLRAIGIIPARGGSKSIPLKNIRSVGRRPLVDYSIDSALESAVLDRIVVSTDHSEIIKICEKRSHIDVIRRPTELATDEAPTELALLHACEELERMDGFIPDVVITLEPTSPLRTPETIRRCVEAFESKNIDSVIGIVETRACYGKIVDGLFSYLYQDQPRRRQDRQPLYREASTIYGTRLVTLRKHMSVLGDSLYPLILPEREALDINEESDIELAEKMLEMSRN